VTIFAQSFVVQIMNKEKSSHLVAIIKGLFSFPSFVVRGLDERFTVPEAEGRTDLISPWFIFNDFAVQNITEAEALSFPGSWKVRPVSRSTSYFLTLRLSETSHRLL
jgi:PAB-dependent poly(A)-specific ribonuclease subunit 2